MGDRNGVFNDIMGLISLMEDMKCMCVGDGESKG